MPAAQDPLGGAYRGLSIMPKGVMATVPQFAAGIAAPQHRALWVLALSGLLGLWIGITGFPNWQVAVETAQVVAGLVTYPSDNPFYVYHVKLWTVLHQVLAMLLRLGVSEIALSEMLSGLLGMVSFQALAMFVYAFSRDGVYAIGSAFAIFFSRAAEFGVAYPISLAGTSHTYGAFGLSTLVLVAALFGAGRYRLGGFLLGLTPALHPSLGVWLGVIVAIAVAMDFKELRAKLRRTLPWFLAGCGLTVVSLIGHLVLASGVAHVETELSDPYLSALVRFWDAHRQPVGLKRPGVFLNFGALGLALTWLLAFAGDLPRASVFLLRFVIVSACLGIAFVFVSWIPTEQLPAFVVILMPLRVLDIDAMTFGALLFGLLGAYRHRLWSQLVALLLLAGLLLGDRSLFWTVLRREAGPMVGGFDPLGVMALGTLAFVLSVCVCQWMQASPWKSGRPQAEGRRDGTRILAAIRTVRTASLGALILYAAPALQSRALVLHDRTNDLFFSSVASGESLLVTGGDLRLIQLRTRRPVLLDGGGLDGLAYALEAGPAMTDILRDVYAIDLFHPPEEGRGAGSIPRFTNRKAWEGYSLQKWREIRRTYKVGEVLTEADWTLTLPTVAEGHQLRLYRIPN